MDSSKLRDIRQRSNTVVRNALANDPGEILLRLLERGYVEADLFSSDPLKMAYNVGKRDLVVLLRRQLNEDIDELG